MTKSPTDMNTHPIDIPTIKSAKNLFLISLVFVAVPGSLMQKYNFWIGLSLTEILLIMIPTIVFIVKGKFSARLVLRLNNPGFFTLVIGVVLGLCVWPLRLWMVLFHNDLLRFPYYYSSLYDKGL